MLLQALGLAVNLSSETLSYETLKIAEMLKKRRGGGGCNSLSSMSNTRKDILLHLFSLPSFSPFSFHSAQKTSLFFSFTSYPYSPFPFFSAYILLYLPSLSVSLTLSCHLFTPTISPLPPSCSAEALGHHPPAPANPCISFPIPIPAGLWHGGDEGTFPL